MYIASVLDSQIHMTDAEQLYRCTAPDAKRRGRQTIAGTCARADMAIGTQQAALHTPALVKLLLAAGALMKCRRMVTFIVPASTARQTASSVTAAAPWQ